MQAQVPNSNNLQRSAHRNLLFSFSDPRQRIQEDVEPSSSLVCLHHGDATRPPERLSKMLDQVYGTLLGQGDWFGSAFQRHSQSREPSRSICNRCSSDPKSFGESLVSASLGDIDVEGLTYRRSRSCTW